MNKVYIVGITTNCTVYTIYGTMVDSWNVTNEEVMTCLIKA